MRRAAEVSLALAGYLLLAHAARADPLNCSVDEYAPAPGLHAEAAAEMLAITWDGAKPGEEVRIRFAVDAGKPIIRELGTRSAGKPWISLATDLSPEYRVVTGLRRITNQQLAPLRALGKEITPAVIEDAKWEAFWDAPLRIGGNPDANSHAGAMPPAEGILSQPGLPRREEELQRATADYKVRGCEVRTNGARLEVSFPGVELGVFSGELRYTVYRGTNLIRQEVVARTEEPSVAYKYDAGLSGVVISPSTQVAWRDLTNRWQKYTFGGGVNDEAVPVQSSNRLIAAESAAGSIAVFPPPHNFFWAREISTNLGYSWYRKDSSHRYSFGVRQPEAEAAQGQAGRGPDDFRDNFALVSARPGTWQRMAVYILADARPAVDTIDAALAYTRGDRYESLPGHQVMLAHVHAYFVRRLRVLGASLDTKPLDFDVARAAGVNIFAPIDGGAAGEEGTPSPEEYLENLATFYEVAMRHSDTDFVVMPNVEVTPGELPGLTASLGGHWDLHMPQPVYYTQGRAPGQSLVDDHPRFGKVYRLKDANDVMEMMQAEGMIAYMPHPRSKGSTGYPDAIRETERFRSDAFRGIGYRWGMGLDGSERRLCDARCLTTLDDMNNWIADLPGSPKYIEAISEFYQQSPGDDIYANTPVNYLRLDKLPEPGDWRPIVETLQRGDYFVTSGEVLIPDYAVEGTGTTRTIVADVQWTFPLEFVEIVWGDGQKTDRHIIPATDSSAFGARRYEIPFDARGKKWVRFAAWDSAGNGALVQPIKLPGTGSSGDRR